MTTSETIPTNRWFEDVSIGDELHPLVKNPTSQQLVMYAGAAGDFVPIHYDKDVANRAGHDRVIIHGALKSAWLAEMITEWAGPAGHLKEFSVSYRAVDYPDEPKTCRGRVLQTRIEDGVGLIDIEIGVEDASGQVTTPATAVVVLPVRATLTI